MEAHRAHISQVIEKGYRGSVFAVLDAGRVHLAVRKRMRCVVCGIFLECTGEDIRDTFRGSMVKLHESQVTSPWSPN